MTIDLKTFLIIGVVLGLLGTTIGASMVLSQKRTTPTERPQRTSNDLPTYRPSRKQLFLPMLGVFAVSTFLLVVGYGTTNIISAAVGFLLLFFSFGLLGAFLFNDF